MINIILATNFIFVPTYYLHWLYTGIILVVDVIFNTITWLLVKLEHHHLDSRKCIYGLKKCVLGKKIE